MPSKDLGTKFSCVKCGTKFYDLKKPDPICPKCGTDQRVAQASKPASSRRAKEKQPAPVEPEVEDTADDEEEAAGTDDAAEVEEEDDEDDAF